MRPWGSHCPYCIVSCIPCQGSPGEAMPRLFGEKLRTLRHQRTMTQVNLATELSLTSYTHITKLEAGHDAPSLELVLRVAHFFGITTDYLLRDTLPTEMVQYNAVDDEADRFRPSHFGTKLRALRLGHHLSQKDLTCHLGLASRAYISNLEAARKLPSLELVVRIADLFGVTTDYLVCDTILVEPLV
jgi:transcriptional regulator with XRE-family HTH domain